MDARERKVMFSLCLSVCLADNMGDVWGDLERAFKLLGLDWPEDSDETRFDEFEALGGVCLHGNELEGGTP